MEATLTELSVSAPLVDTSLKKAYCQFIQELPNDEKETYTSTTLEEVLFKVHDVDHRHSAKNITRSLGQRLQPMLYNFERYGRCLDVFTQIQFTPISLLWGSLRAVIEVASTFLQYFDLLVNMLEKLCDSFNLFRQYEELLGEDSQLQEALCRFYYRMLIFLRKAKITFAKSAHKLLFKSIWRTFEVDYKSILKALDQDTNRLNKAISLAWKKQVFERMDRYEVKQHLVYERTAAQVNGDCTPAGLLEWLSPSNMAAVLERETRRKSSSSGQWCLHHEVFARWMKSNQDSMLWVRGIPGSGKTVLSTSIINYFQERVANRTEQAVGYFFCNRNDKDSQSLLSLLSTILSQIVASFDHVPEPLLRAYHASLKNGRSRISLADQPQRLVTNLATEKDLYLLVDGLDESGDALSIIKTLKTLVDQAPQTHVCFLSRDLQYIREELETSYRIDVGAEQTRVDLDAFLDKKVLDLDLPAPLQMEIYCKLSADANGMFLWADLMIQALENATSIVEVREILKNLPAGLDTTYTHIIQSISQQSPTRRELARKVFLWTCYASRPLSWAELQIAMAQIPGRILSDDTLPFKKVILELCSPLIEYDADSKIFRPAHYSVKEFLTTTSSGERAETISPFISSNPSLANKEISLICLEVLETSLERQGITQAAMPLLEYAIEFWAQHVLSAEFSESLREEILRFLSHPKKRCEWMARYLFQKQNDFPLQRLFRLRGQLQEWMVQQSTNSSEPVNVLNWIQDVMQLLIGSDECSPRVSGFPKPSQTMQHQVSYFEKLMVVRDLSRTYTMTGRLSEGISCMADALRMYTSAGSSVPIEGVWVLNSLGILYDQQKRTVLAIETQQQALALQEQHRGAEHMETVWTVNELGRLYRHMGDLDKAVAMHQRALKVLLRELGSFDLQVTWTLNTLARALRKQERYQEAIEMHEKAIEVQMAALGEKHPHVLWAQSDIARCKSHLGLLEEASNLFRDVLDGRKQVLGLGHADTLWSTNDMALALASVGKYDEARALHVEALGGQVKTLGEEHEHTLWTKQKLEELESSTSLQTIV